MKRAKAIAEGSQVDVSRLAEEAGIPWPVFLARAAYDAYGVVPLGMSGQDTEGRLWDIVWMLRFTLHKATMSRKRVPFAMYIRNDHCAPRLVKLLAIFETMDVDDQRPAITVRLPEEV